MTLLPFNFNRIDDKYIFISNPAGFSMVINDNDLNDLVSDGKTQDALVNAELESKFFISDDVFTAEKMHASALGKKLSAEMKFGPIFMIVPTLRCDHTCKYCQVSRASLNSADNDLPESAVPQIISVIKKLSSKPFKIEIQGGEPLIRFDLIEYIYQEAVLQLGEGSFELIIATSLSLLNDHMITWSENKPVYYSVSLDGNEFIHNKNRLLPDGNSFKLATDNIKRLQDSIGRDRVSTITTVTKALLSQPGALLDVHNELGITDIFIRPISPYGFAKKKDEYSIDEYMHFYRELLDLIIDYNKNGICFVEHSAAIHIKRLNNPMFCGYADLKSPGGVIFNSLLFNYDGKLYGSDESRMLQKVHPEIDFSVGDINNLSFSANPIYQHILSNSFNITQTACNTCAYQPFCGVDPCQNISRFGEPVGNKSMSRFCAYHKGLFSLLIQKMNQNSDDAEIEILKGWSYV
ncbi:His-Xaa-Ser system radical SAM maturase HxsB [Morganella psychrotolerans]|uniref:His-Xaa-Ser system radical SAM maturase HxsB n=1 Tax=Morganella psychrotolerans TaxID=368603 RepID=A0A1B8HPH9_9GAMM|nr:His-Xaa-Ser system radical SAM maturase HxsB [Morganella psychrotolerans]OBU11282.1 His-Xaa-Ser system radical SAM maturase HxsB [Morganella psychrotolerans]